MNLKINELLINLRKLIGYHRQLLEVVRQEEKALASADLKIIRELTFTKEGIISSIQDVENQRIVITEQLSHFFKKSSEELTLSQIVILVQGSDIKQADQLRSVLTTLNLLIQRIKEQNHNNASFLEKSLEHIQKMKMNVLGEASAKSNTYTAKGKKTDPSREARLISKEV